MATKQQNPCFCSKGSSKENDEDIGESVRAQYKHVRIKIREASEYNINERYGSLEVLHYPTIILAPPDEYERQKILFRIGPGQTSLLWDEPNFDPPSDHITDAVDYIVQRLERLLHSRRYVDKDGNPITDKVVDCVACKEEWRPVAEELQRRYSEHQ